MFARTGVCPYRGREPEDEPGGTTPLRAPAQDAAASGSFEPAEPPTEPEIPEAPPAVAPEGPAPDYGWVSFWPERVEYTVAAGDTIGSVAAQFETHAYAIVCLNQGLWSEAARTLTMIAGTPLVIPVGYEVPADAATIAEFEATGASCCVAAARVAGSIPPHGSGDRRCPATGPVRASRAAGAERELSCRGCGREGAARGRNRDGRGLRHATEIRRLARKGRRAGGLDLGAVGGR